LQFEHEIELLDISLTHKCFHIEEKLYEHRESIALGNSVPPVVTNIIIFMEHIGERAFYIAEYKPAVSDTSKILHGLATWSSKIAAISSPIQQPYTYQEIYSSS
jgi:hypothetical protein